MRLKPLRLLLIVSLIFSLGVLLTGVSGAAKEDRQASRQAAEQSRAGDKTAGRPEAEAREETEEEGDDPDMPKIAGVKIDKGEYLRRRNDQIDLLRGISDGGLFKRVAAVRQMELQEVLRRIQNGPNAPTMTWQAIGPAPIPNGQTNAPTSAVSGRVAAIAVHPTNPEIAYIGGAQAGVYRTTDGGATWTPLLDGALSLAIGAIAIVPNDPSTIYVGTGEPALSADAFFGVGIYRIRNAERAPTIEGPFAVSNTGDDIFTGRAISEILVHPTDPNTIFVSTVSGTSGLGGGAPALPPVAGLYRSTNALATAPIFTRLNVTSANGGNRQITDIVMEPGNANRLVAHVRGNPVAGDSGIYVTDDALSAAPAFRQTYLTNTTVGPRGELAINKVGGVVTVIAALGDNNGTVLKSTDGGNTWPTTLTAGAGFCNPQCFYDIAVDIDPTDANKVYLGGAPNTAFKRSTNGGTNFTESSAGLHVDTHVIAVAPSSPNTIYFGSDGGVWRSDDAGVTWRTLNNSTLFATQFQSISIHPSDPKFSIGGTQDNGTEFYRPDGTWVRMTGGDGGQSVIDQNAVTNTAVTAYHTFFNQTGTQIGFQRVVAFNPAGQTQAGTFLGCSGATSNNGMGCTDSVLFYAPLTRGPGSPINTIYFGTNRLYRSANMGTLMTAVSQTLPTTVSAIGIAPSDDAVRVVGLSNGRVYASNDAAATTMREVTGPLPAKYVGRIALDPNNANRAYVAYTGYGLANGQHIWRTDDLSATNPTWQPSAFGIPDVPVNGLVIDPAAPQQMFAGTDIGVYRSLDAGRTWEPFNDGMPRVAVFDLALQNANRILRAATHGRAIYEMALGAAPAATPTPTPSSSFVRFSAASYTVSEGVGVFNVTVETNAPGSVDYAISSGTANQRTDFNLAAGTLTFAAGETTKTIPLLIVDDLYVEGAETVNLSLYNSASTAGPAPLITTGTSSVTITDNDTTAPTTTLFVAQLDSLQEVPPNTSTATGNGTVAVNATGDTGTVNLSFSGLSSAQTGAHIHGPAPTGVNAPILFNLPTGTVTNQSIALTADQFSQLKAGHFYFNVHTANFGGGEIRGQILANPIDAARFFVRQQYLDFLNREPDAAGFNFWMNQIIQTCGADIACTNGRRIGVSAAFFIELEFQETGSVVYRLYKAAYGLKPTYVQFSPDRSQLVGGTGLPASTTAFVNRFVLRGDFTNAYPASLTNEQYVNRLFDKAGLTDASFNAARQAEINAMNTQGRTRAQVLLNVANNDAFKAREFNPSFVLMQYFGYLRRDPDVDGYYFWLNILNQQTENRRGMVCAFITSAEYQQRFAAPTFRDNTLCAGNP